ncbi:hypothetical protein CHIBA101_1947 [Actinomyces sp. Chiba101]|uniref:PqqD family protein n=1 Tax=Actinomyces TaxID=1654 RepID=UPI0009366D3D|nr:MULTISPECIES: PqqD family protein [Actinomyces]BAW93779.1 hypothetical protein CHIBA101_1947 [Actinomyces sp. Chiba101]GAV93971.1 hypothetical protein ADENT20671_0736 [Actinomyces denticolens]
MQLADGIIINYVDDGAIILDSNNGVYFQLNRSAAIILEGLLSGMLKEEIYQNIFSDTGVDEREVFKDIESMVARMSEAGFFIEGDRYGYSSRS